MDLHEQNINPESVVEPELPFPGTDSIESEAEALEQQEGDGLADKLAQLEAALKASEAKVLRVLADMENLKRRSEREVSQAHKFGTESLLKGLIPIVDGFSTGRQSMSQEMADFSTVVEGLDMLERQLTEILEKHGVETINPCVGDAFNAEAHQAVIMQPSEVLDANCIIEVFQKGFQLNGRLLRAAMVVVSQ